MTFYVENETSDELPFPIREVAGQVIEAVLDAEECPYEVQVDILITDNEGIRQINKEFRQMDKPTDVLSFPSIPFEREADFGIVEQDVTYFEPESGELMLGDIVISREKIKEQAENYGHSLKREFAFLIAHSMLHLCGYDHETGEEAKRMEEKQEAVLTRLGITRD